MHRIIASGIVAIFAALAACGTTQSNVRKVTAKPFVPGTKNSYYEVVSVRELRLAPGVRLVPVKGPVGGCGAFNVMLQNNSGGYVSCGCGSGMGNCQTENDNPDHFSCTGGCQDSEGKPVGCQGAILPGPPRDPYTLSFERAARQ
jgi:hypothetical protein